MKKLPDGMKVLRGTDQPSRMGDTIELPPAEGEYPPPDWFPTTQARDEWSRLVPILQSVKVLSEGDLGALALLCALWGDIVKKWEAGITPTASLVSQMVGLYGQFGLTPASRQKVGAAGDAPKENPFKKYGKGGA